MNFYNIYNLVFCFSYLQTLMVLSSLFIYYPFIIENITASKIIESINDSIIFKISFSVKYKWLKIVNNNSVHITMHCVLKGL